MFETRIWSATSATVRNPCPCRQLRHEASPLPNSVDHGTGL